MFMLQGKCPEIGKDKIGWVHLEVSSNEMKRAKKVSSIILLRYISWPNMIAAIHHS